MDPPSGGSGNLLVSKNRGPAWSVHPGLERPSHREATVLWAARGPAIAFSAKTFFGNQIIRSVSRQPFDGVESVRVVRVSRPLGQVAQCKIFPMRTFLRILFQAAAGLAVILESGAFDR